MATRVHPPVWQYPPPLSPCKPQNDGYKSPPTCKTVSTPTESVYATEWWLQESTHLCDSIYPHWVHVRHRMIATRVHPPVWQYPPPLSPCTPQNDCYKSPPTCMTVSTPTESMYATEWLLQESTHLYDSIYPHWVHVSHRMIATRVHPPVWQYLPPLNPCKPQNDGYKSPPTCMTVSTPTESMYATAEQSSTTVCRTKRRPEPGSVAQQPGLRVLPDSMGDDERSSAWGKSAKWLSSPDLDVLCRLHLTRYPGAYPAFSERGRGVKFVISNSLKANATIAYDLLLDG